jgi:hypothetical protein
MRAVKHNHMLGGDRLERHFETCDSTGELRERQA